jgi:uncharacterized protein (UPF0332 family)
MNQEEALIAYRRSRAKETLQDGRILFEAKRFPSAVNRVYYALFYAVTALLLTKGLSSAKHSGVMGLFNEHFVKTGRVPVESGRFFARMFEFRQKSDYGDFVTYEEAKVREWLAQAEQFMTAIENAIAKELEG